MAGGGFGVARGFQQASPLLGASGGPGALRAGDLAPKRCMSLNWVAVIDSPKALLRGADV